MQDKIDKLLAEYERRKSELETIWQRNKCPITQEEAFALFVKCILSSRTKWERVVNVVDTMQKSRVLYVGTVEEVLSNVRETGGRVDHAARAKWIVEDRELFPFVWWIVDSVRRGQVTLSPGGLGPKEVFEQLDLQSFQSSLGKRGLTQEALRTAVQCLKGAGDKQASHFLASLGIEGYAVIDTYILDKLVEFGIIRTRPRTLTPSQYHTIERSLKAWCDTVGIPMHLLDMLWWRA